MTADFELLEDVMEMHLDGTVGDIQPASNLLVRQSLGYQAHDLPLTACQHAQHVLSDRNMSSLLGFRLIGRRQPQQPLAIRDLP